MATMTTVTCRCGCKTTFQARVADRNRGWGLYLNKSHKAKHQEKMTGQYAAHLSRRAQHDEDVDWSGGWDDHKD